MPRVLGGSFPQFFLCPFQSIYGELIKAPACLNTLQLPIELAGTVERILRMHLAAGFRHPQSAQSFHFALLFKLRGLANTIHSCSCQEVTPPKSLIRASLEFASNQYSQTFSLLYASANSHQQQIHNKGANSIATSSNNQQ